MKDGSGQAPQGATTPNLTIFGRQLRIDDKGRLCLTDMHKASGGAAKNAPAQWSRYEEVREFISKVAASEKCGISHIMVAKTGRNGGTFAHWQLALAYAKWLSPELHMEVNRTYMRYKAADPNLALEVIDKQKDVEVLAYIEARTRAKKNYIELSGSD